MIQAGWALHHVGLLTSENLQMDGDRDKGKGGDEKGVLWGIDPFHGGFLAALDQCHCGKRVHRQLSPSDPHLMNRGCSRLWSEKTRSGVSLLPVTWCFPPWCLCTATRNGCSWETGVCVATGCLRTLLKESWGTVGTLSCEEPHGGIFSTAANS